MTFLPADFFLIILAVVFLGTSYWFYLRYQKYSHDPSIKIKNGDAQAYYFLIFFGPILLTCCAIWLFTAIDDPMQVRSCAGRGKCIEAHSFAFSALVFSTGILASTVTVMSWKITRIMKARGFKVDWTNG